MYYEIDAELAASGGASSTCLANQALHEQSESLASLVGPQLVAPGTGPGRDPSLFDRRSMTKWASRITVPVFISGAMQDEQTGPQWPALLTALPKTTPVFANIVNGGHIDSTDPQIISRWLEFLDLYVADKVPTAPNLHRGGRSSTSSPAFAAGTTAQAPLPAIRFTTAKTLTVARTRVRQADAPGRRSSSTAVPDRSARVTPSRPTPPGSPSGRRPVKVTTYYFGPEGSLGTGQAGPKTPASAVADTRPERATGHQPAPGGQRLGGRTRVGLDAGAGRRTGSGSRPRR